MRGRPRTSAQAIEIRAGDLLLLPAALVAFWTLAYQLVIVARWPAQTVVWRFFAIALGGLLSLARVWEKTNATPGSGYQFYPSQLLLMVLAVACAVVVLFIRRPNQDDIVYFHRVLAQLSALDRPIFRHQTSVDMDAAAFSPVHLATSYEMLMALLGHYLRIDPLYFYQVIGHAFTVTIELAMKHKLPIHIDIPILPAPKPSQLRTNCSIHFPFAIQDSWRLGVEH